MTEILLGTWPLAWAIGLFAAGAVAIALTGPKLAALAEVLAYRTGLGQAISGALFLGASTSLSGITTSVTAAAEGHASLSIANAIGGIAAQTVFLAVADMFHRRANLEHAAASPENIFQAGLLMALIALVLMAVSGPEFVVLGVHPASGLIVIGYVAGLRMAYKTREEPMWAPTKTRFTVTGATDAAKADTRSLARLWTLFSLFALAVAASGWLVARSGVSIAAATGASETLVGGLFTAVVTSLPELVTAVTAVWRGALTLAVGDIIGGNAFDTIFAAVADVAYREGSIYHAVGQREVYLLALTLLMTAVLVMGLVRRERAGIANIGFESFLILCLYLGGFALMALG